MFSDGADTTSTSFNDQAVVDYAKAVEATIYIIGFRGSAGLFASTNKGFFRKLCDETAGRRAIRPSDAIADARAPR